MVLNELEKLLMREINGGMSWRRGFGRCLDKIFIFIK